MGFIDFFGVRGRTLFFLGCRFREGEEFDYYREIFDFLGVNYFVLKNVVCCGFPALYSGDKKLARKLARKNFRIFRENKVKKIISSCPEGYYMFKEIYPSLIPEWDIEVEYAIETIYSFLRKRKLRGLSGELVCYHHPCYLRKNPELYEISREVIRLLGGEVVEIKKGREGGLCCGAGGGMLENFPLVAKKMGKELVGNFSEHCVKIVVPCIKGYTHLGEFSDKVVEFSKYVLDKLREVK